MEGEDNSKTVAATVEVVAKEISDHFNNRWGQDAPLTESEASVVAQAICRRLDQMRHQ